MPTGALPEQIGFGRAGLVASRANAASFGQALRLVLDHPNTVAGLSRDAATLLAERQADQSWLELVGSAVREQPTLIEEQ